MKRVEYLSPDPSEAMTSSPAETAPAPPPSKLDLSATKVLASALAAISTAVAASYLGAMGTIIGAGVGSIVATVTTALYTQSLKRTSDKLKQVVPLPTVVVRRRPGAHPAPADPADLPDVHPEEADPQPSDETAVLGLSPDGELTPQPKPGLAGLLEQIRWGRVLAAAAVVFAVSFGALLAYETLIGKSVSDAVQGKPGSGNTIGHVFAPAKKSPSPTTVTPSESPSVQPSPTEAPTPEPTASPITPTGQPAISPQPANPPVTIEPSVPGGGGSAQSEARPAASS
jgi:hypothetical protein